MLIGRYLCRRRRLIKIIQACAVIFLLRMALLSFGVGQYSENTDVYINEYEIPNGPHFVSAKKAKVRSSHLINDHVDMYTSDLLDITQYEYVTGNGFKEYKIPVKNESVAYGPNLDPLEVFVIPFSHVDPGYGMTFEGYYSGRSKYTLTNMVKKLTEYPDLTFQWAETVFLERWWRDIRDDVKNQTRALIKDGRLEILSGGWVMPDEAITHYYPVIDQLIEGHQWLWENLGVKPKNNWANDPFGYSSTFPYLWKKSGMENMVMLRINQALKGTLMKKQALEFKWKPLWSNKSSNDMLCHFMPYRGYWIGDTCGPYNQHICREYAFMHTSPIHKVVFLTDSNIEERARILYEQYRITAEIYRRDNLNANQKPVPQNLYLPIFLGEDFSYVSEQDYDLIHKHYTKLFNYMNAKSEWKIKLKFGTVAEYFSKMKTNQEKRTINDGSRFPTIAGDFLPYLDYQSDFWTGYYTTRPFNKQLSRELQRTLKLADIFHSYAHAHARSNHITYKAYSEVTSLLRDARRELGMFLHHDGITGTSLTSVIQDFSRRIFSALTKTKRAVKLTTSQLLTLGKIAGETAFSDTTVRSSMGSLPNDIIMDLNTNFMKGGSYLTLINPSQRERSDIVSFAGQTKDKYLFISHGQKTLKYQANAINDNTQKIYLPVTLPPLSIRTLRVETFKTKKDMNSTYEEDVLQTLAIRSATEAPSDARILLENDNVFVEIDKRSGFPSKIGIKNDGDTEVDIITQVLAYTSLRSGPYIFAPKGNATGFLYIPSKIMINKGPLVSEVKSVYNAFTLVTKLYNVRGAKGMGVHISALFDLSKAKDNMNKEIILRFKTSINNKNAFYTDQNGFQLIGRKTRVSGLIEENYFPITTMMLIEDSKRRLTLHTAQPHGAACLDNGWMEVMLDRRVSRDDGKGLGQGVMDNVLGMADFILQVEPKVVEIQKQNLRYTYSSDTALALNELLNEPTYSLFVKEAVSFRQYDLHEENLEFSTISQSLPCGVSIVGMRNLAKSDLSYNGTSLVLHNTPSLSAFKEDSLCMNIDETVTLESLFPGLNIISKRETSLTHLYDLDSIRMTDNLKPEDMELRSFKIEF